MPHRCAFGCDVNGSVLHSFPNPDKYPKRFKAWVNFVGGKLDSISDHEIHKKKRLCDNHFSIEHKNRYKRLNALAVPSLSLPDKTKPLNNATVNTPDMTTTHSLNDHDSNQSDTHSVILVAENASSIGKPIISTVQVNTDIKVGNDNKIALIKPTTKILMEHNYSVISSSIQHRVKRYKFTTKEMEALLGIKEVNYALDNKMKTMIFRKLLYDVPHSKAVECWTDIVNVLNKYRE